MDQQYEQQIPQVKSTPYANPMNNFAGSIMFLTSPDNELYKLELTLRNMVQDKDGNPKKAGEPLLNLEGVTGVLGMVQSVVSQIAIMSNVEERMICALIANDGGLADDIARDLMVNRIAYEINNESARDRIIGIACRFAYLSMCRSKEEGERRFWKGSQQEITTRVDGLQGKKGGVLGKLLGWGGGK
jgi:hypothetical protein